MRSETQFLAQTGPAGKPGVPTLSIVVPMYNEAEVLPAFFARLGAVLYVPGPAP